MNKGHYILSEGKIILEPNFLKWGAWFDTADRTISRTDVEGILISTAFLGLDHNFGKAGDPILFETMVFGGKLDGELERYTSREDAIVGHDRMTRRVMASLGK